MNRSAHRRLLQSGCSTAQARGSHQFPSRLVRLCKTGFVSAFTYSPKLLYLFRSICQVRSCFFRLFLHHNALSGYGTLSTATTRNRSTFICIDSIPHPGGSAQNANQKNPRKYCHRTSSSFFLYFNRDTVQCMSLMQHSKYIF